MKCECKGSKEWDREANIVKYQGASPKITQNRFVNSAAKRDQMHARWRSPVEEYSRRRLTVGTDRLPAFAGLATEMQGYLGQRYFARLWEDSFVADLCWHRGEINSGRGRVRRWGRGVLARNSVLVLGRSGLRNRLRFRSPATRSQISKSPDD